ncbi:MAG: YbaB/EbfC family nucleoid-associated protein [bacterium]
MFSKLKHLKDLRSQAKQMQNALADELITVENRGVSVIMDGNMEITDLKIANDVPIEKLENIVKDNANDAIKKTQRLMAKKMQEMGGFEKMGL